MPLHLTWEQIAIRLALAAVASFLIGMNRDEHGNPAGVRTTMLVCMAATLAMIQANLLLPTSGKMSSSFATLDLERLPLGILTGIGFIGAGVILKHGARISGVTTAATIWIVTVLGLLFGAGNLYLGIAGSVITYVILRGLKLMQVWLPRPYRGALHLGFTSTPPEENELRRQLLNSKWKIMQWQVEYGASGALTTVDCVLKASAPAARMPETPASILQLRNLPGVGSLTWKE
jgi:putative Mg2+ transporter-C (MgtC) family protein